MLAEDLVEIEVENAETAQELSYKLRATGTFTEVVPAFTRVAALFSPSHLSVTDVENIIREAQKLPSSPNASPSTALTIPVVYGGEAGPDLEAVAAALDLTAEAVIRTHTNGTYTVDILGFTPGFAYLSGLSWSVPRLPTPRKHVAAGSVGLAGGRTGVYSLRGPGGWPIIGRTSTTLFDPAREPPFVLTPGSIVRFQSVDA